LAVIKLENVSKIFARRRLKRKYTTLRETLLHYFDWLKSKGRVRYVDALRDINLTIERGESVGIIGMNGSGKSTLLKLLAGIYKPDSGRVYVKGRVASLIGLGAGFHPGFTGRENVFINGIILGLSKREIKRKFDDIVKFAELEDYIDEPVRIYSDGMFMRLGFSIATNVDPDILLIDEILAVGDEYFQHKCAEKIAEFKRLGKTMVIVSHHSEAIEKWCDRAVWLDGGGIREDGDSERVINCYRRAIAQREEKISLDIRSSESKGSLSGAKMKRIVQVVHDFLPGHPHGSENYTYHLSKELQKIGKVYIFCREQPDFSDKGLAKDELFGGIPVRRLYYDPPQTFEATYRNSFVDEEFERFLDVVNPDIVHFQHFVRLSASMVEVAKRRGIPTILTLHDFWFLCPQIQLLTNNNQICYGPDSSAKCANCEKIFDIYGELHSSESFPDRKVKFFKYPPEPFRTLKKLVPSRLKTALKEKFLKTRPAKGSITPEMIAKRSKFLRHILDKVDIILAPSKFLREKFISYGIGKNRIVHSDYGIDHRLLINCAKESSDKFRFGFVGGTSEHKGIRVLIRAFNKIKGDNITLSIFGPYHPAYLDKLGREVRIDSRITFCGPFKNGEISSVFSKTDVLVYPSIWYENRPIAILEALSAKIPVITSNLGGMAELVQDGVTGLLFELGNPEDLAQKMVGLIDNPELMRRLSETPRRVKTIEENAEELNEIYDSLLGKAPKTGTAQSPSPTL
jgi:ABC-type polysaccharide/polyol phosphate transport system ATPase subunit/glycosyltransferase involved in cell wall biosynthesis